MLKVDTSTRAGRMLAAGRVTVTFTSPTGVHITLAAKARTVTEEGQWIASDLDAAKVVFIEVPSEGWGDKVGKVTASRGFVPTPTADPARVWCVGQLLAYVAGEPTAAGLQIAEEERCGRCGRALTDPVSIERGIGPECFGRETGSTHQAKAKAPRKPRAPRKGAGVDAKGVAYGHGDWRARKRVLESALAADQTPSEPRWSQIADLPGESFEEIFS